MYRDDGILLARFPFAETMLGQDLTSRAAGLLALRTTKADSTVVAT
jgi:hypothetical protein